MSSTTDQIVAALATAGTVAMLRLIDVLLPKGRHLKAVDRWTTPDDPDQPDTPDEEN